MTPQRVLLVDDEPMVVEVVERYLKREGYAVATAADGPSALSTYQQFRPHIVVLDLMLPGLSGIEVCRRIQAERSPAAVVMLTARGDEIDRIAGFELGADDYVAKPFSPRELMLRVRAVLRRTAAGGVMPAAAVASGSVIADPVARSLTVRGKPVPVTHRELDLLLYLLAHPSEALTRERILEHVWSAEWYGDLNTVTVHIRRLRSKIEEDPERPVHIVTVWGVGYRWDP